MRIFPATLDGLLLLDSRAGRLVGVLVLLLHPWLAALYALPRAVVLGMGVANLCYGLYSGRLARTTARARPAVMGLVVANALWAVACVGGVIAFARSASAFGLLTLSGEAMFVGILAWCEWRALVCVTAWAPGPRPARDSTS